MFTTAGKRTLRNMRDLVQQHLMFKLKVYYKEGSKYSGGVFYGEEWNCTFDQVVWQRVMKIELDRMKGYMDLVNMVENGYLKDKYTTALIYEHDGKDYNTLCRKYKLGVLDKESVFDPVFDETNSKLTLTPLIQSIPGTKHKSITVTTVNFSSLITEQLK